MLTRENALIWPLYAMPYSAYLVEQFCTFLFYAPKFDPKHPYVPDELFIQVWNDSLPLLSDYLDAHFKY